MGSSRSLAILAKVRADEQEWVDAELVEQVELLEAQVASLDSERSRLETELSIAQRWVKELALWLDEAQMPTDVRPVPGALEEDLEEAQAVPIAWGTVAPLTGLILAPWVVLGALIYAI